MRLCWPEASTIVAVLVNRIRRCFYDFRLSAMTRRRSKRQKERQRRSIRCTAVWRTSFLFLSLGLLKGSPWFFHLLLAWVMTSQPTRKSRVLVFVFPGSYMSVHVHDEFEAAVWKPTTKPMHIEKLVTNWKICLQMRNSVPSSL